MPRIFGYGTTQTGATLTREEELAAIAAWRDRRCQRSIARLLRAHVKVAVAAARRWTSNEAALADLVQHGVLGIVRAAERYDPSRGVPFEAFCRDPVRSAVAAGAPSVLSVVGLPSRVWSPSGRDDAPEASLRAQLSLDAPDGDGVPIGRRVADGSPSPEVLAHCASVERGIGITVERALASLSPVEAEVYRRRCLLPSPDPVEEICAALQLTRERAGRIEERTSRLVAAALAAAGWREELAA
jgi:DNA-directed RNA polymerase sigma subunit (sigma70/sigma32)